MTRETKDIIWACGLCLTAGFMLGLLTAGLIEEYIDRKLDRPDMVLIKMDGDDILCVTGEARERVPWAEGSAP